MDDIIEEHINQSSIDGLICWDNISISFNIHVNDGKEWKNLEFSAAFNEPSLYREVREYYGIDIYNQ